MTAFALKIRDSFSDFWLEAELAMGRIFRRKPKAEEPKIAAPPKAVGKTREKTKTEKLPWGLRILRLSAKDRLFLFDQMSTLIGSEVTLIDALNVIRAQTKSRGIKKLYSEMIHHINGGMGLAATMTLFPRIFPKMQVALIEAGEKSGNLSVVLADIVEDMETGQDFFNKVKGAMFYPAILVFLAFILVTGMMIFVIPKISHMYDQAQVKLPKLTQTIIDISTFVQHEWMILFGSIFCGMLLLWLFFSKVRFGQLLWEKMVSVIPFFGTIAREKSLMIIASNMSMLMKSGVLISEAFEITEKTLGNLHYKRALAKVRHDVVMGQSVSESMGLKNIESKGFRENKLFPLQFSQLVRIGETTGRISEMLAKLRSNYHKSIDYKLKNISTVIEPLMIMIVAMLVGTILLAVMLPFFYIGTTIR